MARRSSPWVCTLILTAACGDRFDAVSEHLRVELVGDDPVRLCGGDLPFFERHIAAVSDHLGIAFDHRIDVELSDESGTDRGYYRRRGRKITAERTQLGHELVHAMTADLGVSDFWYIEGVAEAFSGDLVRFPLQGVALPTDSLGRSVFHEYDSAGHFFRWIAETHGVRAGVELLRGRSFMASTGVSVAQAEQAWLETSPWAYPPLNDCEYPPLQPVDGEWHEDISLACADPEVTTSAFFGEGIRHACRTFEVTQPGFYEFASSGDATVRPCFFDVVEEPPVYPSPSLSPISFLAQVPLPILPDGPARFLEEGQYAICGQQRQDERDGTVTVDIVPTATTGVRP